MEVEVVLFVLVIFFVEDLKFVSERFWCGKSEKCTSTYFIALRVPFAKGTQTTVPGGVDVQSVSYCMPDD